ncbi:MAG: hypothetical protein ABSD27_11355 [Bryobacteraceae bacterium]|jgi:hypothetical protein
MTPLQLALWVLLCLQPPPEPASQQPASPPPASQQQPPPSSDLERTNLKQLLTLRRVYVDRLNGGETAVQIRDMIISGLERAKLFVITENAERADAFLRGSAEDLVFTDTFSSSDGINARGGIGGSTGGSTSSRNHRGAYANAGVGETDSLHTAERKHEATASVRLVTKDGDVIWSTTQESTGSKFHGASLDVAEKITRQLLADFARARGLPALSDSHH